MNLRTSTPGSRPLLVTDCDEVLMHMVVPFRGWLDEAHGIDFAMEATDFSGALKRRECGTRLGRAEVWPLLEAFFTDEMARQYPVDGAFEALARIGGQADIVVLTNIGDIMHPLRAAQLRTHGLDCALVCNRGPKGPALAKIIAEHEPSVVVYVDDLAQHIDSAARDAPGAWRLQMVAEPEIAPQIATAPCAHARIDDWASAINWIEERFAMGHAAPDSQA